jgi:hypothetical protein
VRTRLPAALLLLLSWFLPAAGQAQLAAAHVVAVPDTARQTEQHPGARQAPSPPPHAHARTGAYDTTGGNGPAVLPAGVPAPGPAWSAVVRRIGGDGPPARHQSAGLARAPPSTRF